MKFELSNHVALQHPIIKMLWGWILKWQGTIYTSVAAI
jgi:hypothetical protein